MDTNVQLELFSQKTNGFNLVKINTMLELPRGLLREYRCSVEDAIQLYGEKFKEKPTQVYVMGERVFIPFQSQ